MVSPDYRRALENLGCTTWSDGDTAFCKHDTGKVFSITRVPLTPASIDLCYHHLFLDWCKETLVVDDSWRYVRVEEAKTDIGP